MKISALRCETALNPLGIGVLRPRLFWKLDSPRNGARQIAYRLRCRDEKGDLWDSGRVERDQTTHVEYDGPQLQSRQRVLWSVEVEDETGTVSSSEMAWWEMGLLEKGNWKASWIGGNRRGDAKTAVPAPFLRREFSVDKPIKSARLYATALGLYECEINGQKVGDHVFSPGWTDYKQRVQYQSFDVTKLLQNGPNAWGAILGDGWCCGFVGWGGRQNYGEAPKFRAQLEVEFEDGEKRSIATDNEWKLAYGPILENDLIRGEHFDARLDFPGWNRAGFNDSKWQSVEELEAPDIEISAPLGPPVRAIQEIAPIGIQANGVVDFGQNLVGRVRLKVSGPRGTTIGLRFAETLEKGPGATSGPIYTENLRSATQTDSYTLSGEGEEIWEPRFTFHGFRFVEVSGWPGELTPKSLTAVVLHSDTPKTGEFTCSDELINQLQRNIDWGQRGNFLDVPTDCPQRDERLGWTGDAQVFIRTAAFNRDVAGFFSKWQRDIADAQNAAGAVPCVVPSPPIGSLEPSGPHIDGGPAWADAALICPWTIYQCYGDARILGENYAVFEKYLGFLEATSRDLIRPIEGAEHWWGFGDWLALDGGDKLMGATPHDLIGTAFFAHDAALMSQIARVLGKTDDAAHYGALHQRVKTAFNARFVAAGDVICGTQTAYLLALHFDLLPENQRQDAADALAADIEAHGWKLTTGFVGSPYLNHVLTRFGHLDVAFKLLHQTEWPSWLYAVTQGATTIWERWNGWTHDEGFADAGMNSFNHYAYGAVGAWLYQVVAGIEIDPNFPGYKRFILSPKPGGKLTSARAHLETLHGRIESDWKLQNGVFEWNFRVPANTRAQILAPNGERFEAQSGTHFFRAALD